MAVATAYAELSMTPGCSAKAQAIAMGAGSPPPLAWDKEDLDDPSATPVDVEPGIDALDEVAVEAIMGGRRPNGLREPERIEAVRRLARGWTDLGIARQLGVCDRTVLRWRQRHGIKSRWVA